MNQEVMDQIRKAIRTFSRKEHPVRREMTEGLLIDVIRVLAKELRENVVVAVDLKGRAKVAYVDTATIYAVTNGNVETNLKRLLEPEFASRVNRFETATDYRISAEVCGGE